MNLNKDNEGNETFKLNKFKTCGQWAEVKVLQPTPTKSKISFSWTKKTNSFPNITRKVTNKEVCYTVKNNEHNITTV